MNETCVFIVNVAGKNIATFKTIEIAKQSVQASYPGIRFEQKYDRHVAMSRDIYIQEMIILDSPDYI